MAFEVTATRKRPRSFSALFGQDFLVATLTRSLEQKHIANAYLFSGPRGVGKTSAARILAKSLNCVNGPTATPCGECTACLEIQRGNSIDVIEIDGASNTSVNDVREIKDEVLFAPNYCRYKVYIIDEVHMLSNSAFNALLKTIEEPPPYIVFIFATTEIHKVPATIRSRCQQFNFRLIDLDTIKKLLVELCSEEKIKWEDDALLWIARESTGSLRDAYTLFDQINSFSEKTITLEKIRDKLGIVGLDEINSLFEKIIEHDAAGVLHQLDETLKKGVSVEQCIIDMSEYLRNILLIKAGITREAVIGVNPERYPEKIIASLSSNAIEYALETLLTLYRDLRYSLDQRTELEVGLHKFLRLNTLIFPADIIGRLRELRESIGPGPAGGPEKEHPLFDEQNSPEKSEAVHSCADDIMRIKGDTLALLKKKHVALASALEQACEWKLESGNLLLVFENKFSAEKVRNNLPPLQQILRNTTGRDIPVHVEIAATGNEIDKSGDTKIGMVKKVFRGEIIQGDKQ